MRGTGSATDLSKSIYSLKQQQQNGMLLKDLPEEMKGDRELCMAAVAQDWLKSRLPRRLPEATLPPPW